MKADNADRFLVMTEASSLDDLILRARDGDDEAFRRIVDSWAPRVLAFMRSRLGSEEDALDATQEVFVRVWSALGRFRIGESFSPWLFSIAANLARSRWRSRFLDSKRTAAAAAELAVAPAADPSEEANDEIRAEELRRAVASLSPEFRRPVELYYFGGLDIRETAASLGLGEEAVKSRLFRARAKLRNALEKPQPAARS